MKKPEIINGFFWWGYNIMKEDAIDSISAAVLESGADIEIQSILQTREQDIIKI
jgi:hypothetical protein